MKARKWDRVRLVTDMPAQAATRSVIPAGTLGTVTEVYASPAEGYSVDLAIPDRESVTGYDYDCLVLRPDEFTVVMRYVEDEAAQPATA